jgi:hypothetical protein
MPRPLYHRVDNFQNVLNLGLVDHGAGLDFLEKILICWPGIEARIVRPIRIINSAVILLQLCKLHSVEWDGRSIVECTLSIQHSSERCFPYHECSWWCIATQFVVVTSIYVQTSPQFYLLNSDTMLETLATELQEKICRLLDGPSLLRACCVSVTWHRCVNSCYVHTCVRTIHSTDPQVCRSDNCMCNKSQYTNIQLYRLHNFTFEHYTLKHYTLNTIH